jgi:hypothetical protein
MPLASLERLNQFVEVEGPCITFEQFLELLRPFSAESLAAACTDIAWHAWRGEFVGWTANEAGLGFAPLISALALARATGGQRAARDDVVTLVERYVAIRASPTASLDFVRRVAREMLSSDAAFMMPDSPTAAVAERLFNHCRTMYATWLPSRIRLDEFVRSWWFARQLNDRAANLDRVNRILGMEIDVFVRAAVILFAVAIANAPSGHIRLAELPDSTLSRYRISRDALRLAVARLAANGSDVEAWITNTTSLVPEGLRHYQPSVLVACPLLNVTALASARDAQSHDLLLCPSPVHLMGTVRDRIREAISTELVDGPETQIRTLYGELLEDYVEFVSQSPTVRVVRLDLVEPAQRQHADILLRNLSTSLRHRYALV